MKLCTCTYIMKKKLDPIKRQCKEMFTFECQLQQNVIMLQQHTIEEFMKTQIFHHAKT